MMSQIFEKYFTKEEIPKVEQRIEKDSSFKEKVEKIKKGQIDLQLDNLENKIQNKTESNFEERFEAFKKAVLDLEKNQDTQTETVKQKAKKQAEEQGFSWDKVKEVVEKNGGWFSWAGISAGIGAIFSGLFSGIIDKMSSWFSKKGDEIEKKLDSTITNLTAKFSKETPGIFKNNEYISYKKKFDIKFDSNKKVKFIRINGEEYLLDGDFSLEEENGKYYLVSNNFGIKSKYNLDYIGFIIDERNYDNDFNEIKISDNNAKEIFNIVPDDWEFWSTDLIFRKKESLAKIEKNKIKVGNIEIEFDKNIDKNGTEGVEIKEINISGKEYSIEPKGTKFDLSKEGLSFILKDNILLTIGQDKIKLSDISKKINEGNKTDNGYILLNKNIGGTKNRVYLKEIK